MMAGVIAVGLFLLIEVKAHFKILMAKPCVHVEARIARRSERSDEAHLTVFLALKRIAGAPEEINGVVGDVFDGEFHVFYGAGHPLRAWDFPFKENTFDFQACVKQLA